MLARFAQRHNEEGILLGLAPARECEPPAGLETVAEIGEGSHGVGEEHDAESRDNEIPLGLEIVNGGVRECEAGRQAGGRALAGAGQHWFGNVEPEDLAAGAHALCEIDRRRAASAADVDHPFARLGVRRRHQPVGNRL